MMTKKCKFIVVTGCSKGIGLSYVHELAKKGMMLREESKIAT